MEEKAARAPSGFLFIRGQWGSRLQTDSVCQTESVWIRGSFETNSVRSQDRP